jgi:hypothetical protein
MMNIVQAKGKHTLAKVHNAILVTEKYNFSVKALTEAAWNCQKQSGRFEFDVWNSSVYFFYVHRIMLSKELR